MARRKIKFENNEYYHIYNRGVDKRNIISDEFDMIRILESLAIFNTIECVGSLYEYMRIHKDNSFRSRGPKLVEIIAFNILDNHYHLVFKQLVDNGISRFMQDFGAGYTKYYNEKYKRSGVLFQGSFKAEHIDSDEYLNYVVAYVNGNHFVHGLELSGNPISKWGMRSSLEQYILDKKDWKNRYFECDLSMIKHRHKKGTDYLDEVKGIAKNIRTKRGKENDDFKSLEF